jgi:CarD family transcriptional regulator
MERNMFAVGDKIIYNENGVCTVEAVGPDSGMGSGNRLYYTLSPMVGTGTFYAPVDTKVFMRS